MSTSSSRRPVLSYELFPARSDASFSSLQETIAALEQTDPAYVCVTSRTGHTNHDRVLDVAGHLLRETSLRPLVHLTCARSTAEDLRSVVGDLLDMGVRGLLALRGDHPAGHDPQGDELPFARYLVELIREVERERTVELAAGRLAVGVAAYPHRHPESPTAQHDVEVLVSKQRSGADFAITQVFFEPAAYVSLVQRARRAGVTMPIVPGFVPATDPQRLHRLAQLSGVEAPRSLLHALETAADPAERRRIGIAFTVDLVRRTLDLGAPGLHLFTFNRHHDALALLEELDLTAHASAA